MAEFLAAIDQSKTRSSTGPDGATREGHKNLDDPALSRLFDFINEVWLSAQIPESWLRADIVPIPNPGKPSGHLPNLRPIA